METRTVGTIWVVACLLCVCITPVWGWPWEDAATKEAQTVAEAAVNERAVKCGDSHFLKMDRSTYVETKEMSVTVTPKELTDVDKANGVDWQGGLLVSGKMYRILEKQDDGSVSEKEWRDGRGGIPGITGLTSFHDPSGKAQQVRFRKVNGQWSFDQKDVFGFMSGLPKKEAFACEDITRTAELTSPASGEPSIPEKKPTDATVTTLPPAGWKRLGTFSCPVGWNVNQGWCPIGAFGPGTIRIVPIYSEIFMNVPAGPLSIPPGGISIEQWSGQPYYKDWQQYAFYPKNGKLGSLIAKVGDRVTDPISQGDIQLRGEETVALNANFIAKSDYMAWTHGTISVEVLQKL